MDYEKKHKEEIVRATQLWECGDITRENLEYIFPELAESEDEKIRKAIIEFFELQDDNTTYSLVQKKDILAWLEKQGEPFDDNIITRDDEILQAISIGLTDVEKDLGWSDFGGLPIEEIQDWLEKQGEQEEPQVYKTKDSEIITYSENEGYKVIEPKFHEGDWIISKYMHLVMQILNNDNGFYKTVETDGTERTDSYDFIERNFKLWSIEDAKDGDVLAYVTDEDDLWIIIFRSLYEPYEGHVHYHALLVNDEFSDKGTCCICINDLKPATKEQSSILFKKMHEAGYEWDAKKKELRKIEKQGEQSNSSSIWKYKKDNNPLIHDSLILNKYGCVSKSPSGAIVSDVWVLDYDELATLPREIPEKQGEQKPTLRERYENIAKSEWFKKTHEGISISDEESKWTEEDECYIGECISAIATKDCWSSEEKRKTKHWLKSLKQRMEEHQ